MTEMTPPLSLPVAAPEMVLRLGGIVAGLIAVVARRFLRDPTFSALIMPLCGWLGRTVRRFGRVAMRAERPAAAARAAVVAARPAAPEAPDAPDEARVGAARVRLPGGRGWLVRALGWEVVAFGSQLEALIAEPEMQALLARVPAAGRLLRPLCRMLGVSPVGVVVPRGAAVRKPRVRKPRVRAPRVRREKPWSPGRIRPFWAAKNEA